MGEAIGEEGDPQLLQRGTRGGYNELGGDVSEWVGRLASHRLTQLTGGPGSLLDFYRHIGFGRSVDEAFEYAFGLSLEQFNGLFRDNWADNTAWGPQLLAAL